MDSPYFGQLKCRRGQQRRLIAIIYNVVLGHVIESFKFTIETVIVALLCAVIVGQLFLVFIQLVAPP